MLSAGSTIHIDVLVMSEFINSYTRLEWRLAIQRGLGAEFKEFREGDEFPPVALRIAADAKLILQRCQCIESGFSKSNIAGVLTEYETGRKDFNDQMLADILVRPIEQHRTRSDQLPDRLEIDFVFLISSRFREFLGANRKISRIRMVKHQCRNARFGFHHETFSQLNPDLFRVKQTEQLALRVEIGTGGITK